MQWLRLESGMAPTLTSTAKQRQEQLWHEAYALTVEDMLIMRRIPVWIRVSYSRSDRLDLRMMCNRLKRQLEGLCVSSLASRLQKAETVYATAVSSCPHWTYDNPSPAEDDCCGGHFPKCCLALADALRERRAAQRAYSEWSGK